MADQVLTKQKLINGDQDLSDLEEVLSGPPGKLVKTRLGREVYTLASVPQINTMTREEVTAAVAPKANQADVDAALSSLSTTANAFRQTLAAANADIASFTVNQTVWVGELDTGGLYYKPSENAASFLPSPNNPLTQSQKYTNAKLTNISEIIPSKNLYNPENVLVGKRISGAGAIIDVVGGKCTNYIEIVANLYYTISAGAARPAHVSFYDAGKVFISNNNSTSNPLTIQAPSNAKYLIVNIQSETVTEPPQFQIEEGVAQTNYSPFGNVYKILNSALPDEVIDSVHKDYDIQVVSKNLFDEARKVTGQYLSSNSGDIDVTTGWVMSNKIPVEAGKTYTLSGQRSRQGLSFFASASTITALAYFSSTSLPLTVTAPSGANFVAFNLATSTATTFSNVQFEEGAAATEYLPFGYSEVLIDRAKVVGLDLDINEINTNILELTDRVNSLAGAASEVSLTNGVGYISNGTLKYTVVVFKDISYSGSSVFNFQYDENNGTRIRTMTDDVAPVRMMGTTIGANHGFDSVLLTVNAHEKTVADVGSVWTNGLLNWSIAQIVNVNQLVVVCRNVGGSIPAGNVTFTHISGATNTATFTASAKVSSQWYPMLKNHKVDVISDGVSSSDANLKKSFSKTLSISESYDLMEKSDIYDYLVANSGREVKNYLATSAINVSNVHSFDAATLADTIYCNFFTYKALSAAQDIMLTQSARLEPVNGEVLYYVPRSMAFTHESVNYDFSKPINVSNLAITTRIDFDAAKAENGAVLPDRLIMLAGNLGYATGYLPVLDASPDVRNLLTSKGIQISNSGSKVYPYLVDGLTTLPAGANYSAIAYRVYFKKPTEIRRTSEYLVNSDFGDFLFLDWHVGGFIDVVELGVKLQARSFEIVEKTSNVKVLSKVASNNMAIEIGVVTSNARLILKFN